MLAGDAQHAAGPGGGVVDASAPHRASISASSSSMKSRFTMSRMTSRGVKCSPGRLVGQLGELADEFLEHRTHLRIADRVRVQVDVRRTSP